MYLQYIVQVQNKSHLKARLKDNVAGRLLLEQALGDSGEEKKTCKENGKHDVMRERGRARGQKLNVSYCTQL